MGVAKASLLAWKLAIPEAWVGVGRRGTSSMILEKGNDKETAVVSTWEEAVGIDLCECAVENETLNYGQNNVSWLGSVPGLGILESTKNRG
jgi:hypothetical protein